MKFAKTIAVSPFALLLCALAANPVLAQQTPIKPGAIKGETLILTKARNYAFCEIYVGFGKGPSTQLECYNTSATKGPDGGCPPEAFAALNKEKLAASQGASSIVLNPPAPTARKRWVMDELYIYAAGETYDFFGVKGTWVAKMSLQDLEEAVKASKTPYQALTNTQLSKWVYKKGSPVYLLRAPEGKVYVMQSVTNIVDKDLTYEQLPQLGSKLKQLPPGWKYEVKTLTQELAFDVRNATPSGLKHLTLDELGNVYLGCGFDAACNYIP